MPSSALQQRMDVPDHVLVSHPCQQVRRSLNSQCCPQRLHGKYVTLQGLKPMSRCELCFQQRKLSSVALICPMQLPPASYHRRPFVLIIRMTCRGRCIATVFELQRSVVKLVESNA